MRLRLLNVIGSLPLLIVNALNPRSRIQHLPLATENALYYKVSANAGDAQKLTRLTKQVEQVGEVLAQRSCIVLKNADNEASSEKPLPETVVVQIGIARAGELKNDVCGFARRSFRMKNRLTFTKASIKISENCINFTTIAHELLHVLGFDHAQDRADSPMYLRAEGRAGSDSKKKILHLEDVGAFDCKSIMLYDDTPLTRFGREYFEENGCVSASNATVRNSRIGEGDLRRLNWLHCAASEPGFDRDVRDLQTNLIGRLQLWSRQGISLEPLPYANFSEASGLDPGLGMESYGKMELSKEARSAAALGFSRLVNAPLPMLMLLSLLNVNGWCCF